MPASLGNQIIITRSDVYNRDCCTCSLIVIVVYFILFDLLPCIMGKYSPEEFVMKNTYVLQIASTPMSQAMLPGIHPFFKIIGLWVIFLGSIFIFPLHYEGTTCINT